MNYNANNYLEKSFPPVTNQKVCSLNVNPSSGDYCPSDYCFDCQANKETNNSQVHNGGATSAAYGGSSHSSNACFLYLHSQKCENGPHHKLVDRPSYICTIYCKYDIVRQVAFMLGMRESHENWNVMWSDFTFQVDRVKRMKRYQKVNHFPGMGEICRKDLLARNLNRMFKLFPDDYDFFPRTWLLPLDFSDVSEYAKNHKNKTYILKPDVGCKGKGIMITKNTRQMSGMDRTICQVYVSKPYLINGFKFDLRIYALLTSCDPLRLYVYNEGLVRFATAQYVEPTRTNITNMYMHLTNYSVNKFSRTYISDPYEGSKRKISTLNEILKKQYHDVKKLWKDIDDVIVKTVFLALPTLQHNYRTSVSHNYGQACFELLGFDLILDHNLRPYLLEVNHSPSFHTDAPIDREVKEALLFDTFKILNLQKNNRMKVLQEEKQHVTNRLLKDLSPAEPCKNEQSPEEQLRIADEFEYEHMGNYRRIYPCEHHEKYDQFFCQGTSSLFNETFASRARGKASKILQEKDTLEQNMANMQLLERPKSIEWIVNNIKPDEIIKERTETKKMLKNSQQFSEHSKSMCIFPKIVNSSLNYFDTAVQEKILNRLNKREETMKSSGVMQKIHSIMKINGQVKMRNEINKVRHNKWPHEEKNVFKKRITLEKCLRNVIENIDSSRVKLFNKNFIPYKYLLEEYFEMTMCGDSKLP